MGIEHAETLNLFRLDLFEFFSFKLLSEKSNFFQRICPFHSKTDVADGKAQPFFVNASHIADFLKNFIFIQFFFENFQYSLIGALFKEIVKLPHELVDLPGLDSVEYIYSSLEVIFVDSIGAVGVFLYIIVYIFNFVKDIVSQFDIFTWILKNILAIFFEIELGFDFWEDVTDHQLYTFAD